MDKYLDLKEQWLSQFPNSNNDYDLKRFIRFAIALAREERALDVDELIDRGVSPEKAKVYQRLYEFLRRVLDVIDEEK